MRPLRYSINVTLAGQKAILQDLSDVKNAVEQG